jgi:hypothetical protein
MIRLERPSDRLGMPAMDSRMGSSDTMLMERFRTEMLITVVDAT